MTTGRSVLDVVFGDSATQSRTEVLGHGIERSQGKMQTMVQYSRVRAKSKLSPTNITNFDFLNILKYIGTLIRQSSHNSRTHR